jgi:hypothetical protein
MISPTTNGPWTETGIIPSAIGVLVAHRCYNDKVVVVTLAVVRKDRPSLRFSEITFTKNGEIRVVWSEIDILVTDFRAGSACRIPFPFLQMFARTASGDVLYLPICMWLMAHKECEKIPRPMIAVKTRQELCTVIYSCITTEVQ